MLDFSGADAGSLAIGFGGGWGTCLALLTGIGKILGKAKDDRIDQLANDLANEKTQCREDKRELSDRIGQLETILLMHSAGPLRQDLQKAISEQRVEDRP